MIARRLALRLCALPALCLLPQCMLEDQALPREEKYVTVRLNDSLKGFDSVEIVILAGGDSAQIVGTVWKGALPEPGKLPSFRVPDGETRELSVRVRGFDGSGSLALNFVISKESGGQVIADLPLPIPPVVVPPDTGKPPLIVPPDTAKPPDTVPVPVPMPGLRDLKIAPGALAPAWDSTVTKYAVGVAHADSAVVLTAVPRSPQAVVRVGIDTLPNGKASQPFTLKVGSNSMLITTSHLGAEARCTVLVTRAAATNPDGVIPGDRSAYRTWKHRGTVFVDLKQLGMNNAWGEAGIPLLLRLTADNFDFTQATYNGRDIRFARADGYPIPYEIARWEPEQSRAEIWIKSFDLRAADDSAKYYMYWGSVSAKSESAGERVFSPLEQHTAVYHLSEEGYGVSDEYKDAVGRYHGQGGDGDGLHVPRRVEGIVGYGQDFHPTGPTLDGRAGDYQAAIGLPEILDPGGQAWTFQTWIRRVGNDQATIFKKGDEYMASRQRFFLRVAGNTGGQVNFGREGADHLTNTWVPNESWIQLGVVYTGTRYDVYVDGYLRESNGWTQGSAMRGDCVLGAWFSDGSSEGLRGILDEVWIGSKARSPMWMRMTFETQRPGSTVVTLRR